MRPFLALWFGWALAAAGAIVASLPMAASQNPESAPLTGSSPRITEITRDSGVVSLTWTNTGAPAAFTVEANDSLASGTWQPAPASVWPINLGGWTDPWPGSAGARFYRITATEATADRGTLLSSSLVSSLSPADVQALYKQNGIPLAPGLPVKAFKLVYETINPFQVRTVASGLLVLPDGATNALPLVSYQHGTIVQKSAVPSNLQGLESVIGVAMGTSGYAAALPDYVGLGESPGLHPFVHAQSEAAAAVDMLRAARIFCAAQSVALNGQLFLMGYSEGGHATMALDRELESHETNEFTVTAAAPMAGPYDLSGTMVDDFLSGRSMPNPYYFFYLVAAYQSIYHVVGSLSQILAPPFDRTLPPLLDGQHDSSAINQAMGSSNPENVFKPEFLQDFRNDPNHPLRVALRENDVYDWTPRAPMRLYHCVGDQDVLFKNSQVALASFQAHGNTNIVLYGGDTDLDHTGCAPPSLFAAKLWFDSLKKP